MIGDTGLITASALDPRRSHISAASRFRISFTDALLGLISSFPLRYSQYFATVENNNAFYHLPTPRTSSPLGRSGRLPGS